jgi:acyl-coenzyme A synthetase/AMP-(fatty) acid ligase
VKAGRGEQLALIYDSPVTGQVQRFTYQQLLDQVATFAGALQQLGVGKGDRVVIYMPMIPQAAIAMLAVARLGAVHSVVFGGFSAHELAIRIDDATPKVVVSASCGIEISRVIAYKPLLDEALSQRGCDHTLRLTTEWLVLNNLPIEPVVNWLHENGGYCDCEALAHSVQAWHDATGGVH